MSNNTAAVRIYKNQLAQIRQAKEKTGMSITFIMAMAITEWLIKHEPAIYEQGVAMHKLNSEEIK